MFAASWMRRRAKPRRKPQTLAPVHPSAGFELAYRRKLDALVCEMQESVVYWIRAAYRQNEPAMMATDALPANTLNSVVKKLSRRWQRKFRDASGDLARYFATGVARRSDDRLRRILKRGGFTVEFKNTQGRQDILYATINEQVGLIRSIPQKYFTEVEGAVMRSVQAGRDIGGLTKFLQRNYQVTRRRAALIARDQNNKSTANMVRARQVEVGIKEAIWVHSGGGKEPRPTHLKAGRDRQRYDVAKGWYDPQEKRFVHPSELINCKCTSRSVVPGFGD